MDARYELFCALVAYQIEIPENFWLSVYQKNPEKFCGIAFSGLALNHPEQALDFMAALPKGEGPN